MELAVRKSRLGRVRDRGFAREGEIAEDGF